MKGDKYWRMTNPENPKELCRKQEECYIKSPHTSHVMDL